MKLTATPTRALSWVAIALVVVLALWQLGPVLTPFVVGSVLAYALTPLVNRLDALGHGWLPRVAAVVVVELLFILLVLSLLLLIVPILTQELPLMREQLPLLADQINAWVSPWLLQFGVKGALDVVSIKAFVLKYLNANAENTFGSLLSSLKLGGSLALALVGNLILIPVALFYLLMDWERFVSKVMALVPRHLRSAVDSFTQEADAVLGQYLRGQLLVMLLMAVFYSSGLALFGLDLALPIGAFTGLAMFVPYLGFGIGLILAVLAGLLQFLSIKALLMVTVVYGIGQLMHVSGLAVSGGYGVQRKVAGAEQMLTTLPQKIGMGVMGLGGTVAIVGGIMFVVVCLKAMSKQKITSA